MQTVGRTFFHVVYKPDGSQLIENVASDFSGKLVLALSSGHRSVAMILFRLVWALLSCELLVPEVHIHISL